MASGNHDVLDLVNRFVCLGSEEGHVTVHNLRFFKDQSPTMGTYDYKEKGQETVKRLKSIYQRKGFIIKEPLLFAIAHVIRNTPITDTHEADYIRREAYALAQEVCESAKDLFTFVHFDKVTAASKKASFGRGMKSFINRWYDSKSPLRLAYEVTQCKSGRGWTHRDLIRLSHISTDSKSKGTSIILKYLTDSRYQLQDDTGENDPEVAQVIEFLKDLKTLTSTQPVNGALARNLIEKHKFMDRQIPSFLMNSPETFEGLLGHMNLDDIFKLIPKLAALGMLDQGAVQASLIIDRVKDLEAIKSEKIHPVVIFLALRRYESNKIKKWTKNFNLTRALQAAFAASLQSLPSIGKRTFLAIHIDAKTSKHHVIGANQLTPLTPSSLMTKLLLQSEEHLQLVFFNKKVEVINLKRSASMPQIIEVYVNCTKDPLNAFNDLAEPIKWATQNKKPFDNILIISDKKTVSSVAEFHEAVNMYRSELSLPDTKIMVVGLSDDSTVCNKLDFNMCEISGFNDKIPSVIYNFFLGHYDITSDIDDNVPCRAVEEKSLQDLIVVLQEATGNLAGLPPDNASNKVSGDTLGSIAGDISAPICVAGDIKKETPCVEPGVMDMHSDMTMDVPSNLINTMRANTMRAITPCDIDIQSDVSNDMPVDLPISLPSDVAMDLPGNPSGDIVIDTHTNIPTDTPSNIPSNMATDVLSNSPSTTADDTASDTPIETCAMEH